MLYMLYLQYATLEYTREHMVRSQPHLFDYAMVVGLEKDPETTKYRPHIMYKYPDQVGTASASSEGHSLVRLTGVYVLATYEVHIHACS